MTFEELNVSDRVLAALKRIDIVEPTEIQSRCIDVIRRGGDLIGRSQTGSGKTFAFGIPMLERLIPDEQVTQALIMCPTRELALQVADEIRKLSFYTEGCKIVPVFGGASIERQITMLKRNAKVVVGTPGRILDHIRRGTIKLDCVRTVILDEADEMLNMGFRDDMEKILSKLPAVRQTLMFSATMPRAILEITDSYMQNPELIEVGADNRPIEKIEQLFTYVSRNSKKNAFISLYKEYNPALSIVFCNTKRMVDDLTKFALSENINAQGLHGDMRQNERRRVMESVHSGKTAVLIATDVAARGIDINNVDIVFNYDVPQNIDYYIHRIGRTARAGKSGISITLLNDKSQLFTLREIEKTTGIALQEKLCDYSLKDAPITKFKDKRESEDSVERTEERSKAVKKRWGKPIDGNDKRRSYGERRGSKQTQGDDKFRNKRKDGGNEYLERGDENGGRCENRSNRNNTRGGKSERSNERKNNGYVSRAADSSVEKHENSTKRAGNGKSESERRREIKAEKPIFGEYRAEKDIRTEKQTGRQGNAEIGDNKKRYSKPKKRYGGNTGGSDKGRELPKRR